jgi:hypothetical protein
MNAEICATLQKRGKTVCYSMGELLFEPRQQQEVSISFKLFRLTLDSTQIPNQLVQSSIPGDKAARAWFRPPTST